eukprot:gene7692-11804_t
MASPASIARLLQGAAEAAAQRVRRSAGAEGLSLLVNCSAWEGAAGCYLSRGAAGGAVPAAFNAADKDGMSRHLRRANVDLPPYIFARSAEHKVLESLSARFALAGLPEVPRKRGVSSLSHDSGVCVAVVSNQRGVGVDVVQLSRVARLQPASLAALTKRSRLWMRPEEQPRITPVSLASFWGVKEVAAKALGQQALYTPPEILVSDLRSVVPPPEAGAGSPVSTGAALVELSGRARAAAAGLSLPHTGVVATAHVDGFVV